MSRMNYPFSAIVGMPAMKLALMISAVDHRLSVLLRGDKGSGKSTAARGLASLLPSSARFVNLPLGATEDRLLGGLDLGRTMKGDPSLKPGLLAEAHGGVVYIDEVNLLPDHLADSLLDVASGGVMFLEREGFSGSHECRFLLLGSMNPEEGELRPQLLDRFALIVDVQAPADTTERRSIVERRLAFEAHPKAFLETCAPEEKNLQATLDAARANLADVVCPSDLLEEISRAVTEHNVRSLRADLAIVRASIARAALDDSRTVLPEHVEAVLPLVLGHRAKRLPPPPGSSHTPKAPQQDSATDNPPAGERVFLSRPIETPRLLLDKSPRSNTHPRGPVITSRSSTDPLELDTRRTVMQATVTTGEPIPRPEHLHEKVRDHQTRTRFVFVVDSSGSHGAKDRMRVVKGAVAGLLNSSSRSRDEVCVVAFRGTSAQLVMEPTRDAEAAIQALEYLPTGGRTPLANGLESAMHYLTNESVMVLLTDGRANVPSTGSDAWADALAAARSVRCPALVIDTEAALGATGRPVELAQAMGARHIRLDELGPDQELVLVLQGMR